MNETEQNKLNKQLFAAVKAKNTNLVSELIKAGADVNVKSMHGNALGYAVMSEGGVEMVGLLLKLGASVDIKDNAKSTPHYIVLLNLIHHVAFLKMIDWR
jgi:ankyrin repeat protein